ncbi:hypothetical protein DL240_05205 [Lujinxingia litoralis]|uniref:Uncharacterized protein n=1 Tax=Lujinxingia litoralis TaxID=2211119 RepID=A0A328C9E3_9DELT|nr:hypothetical protein DL240_05205 [Lujinxingia litoralis]
MARGGGEEGGAAGEAAGGHRGRWRGGGRGPKSRLDAPGARRQPKKKAPATSGEVAPGPG